jgi:hypothetical protein
MSDAEDRFIAAWSRLAQDVVTAALSHNDVYATGGWKLPDRFKVSPNIRCAPAATKIAGQVRVPVPAPAPAPVPGAAARPAPQYQSSPVRPLEYPVKAQAPQATVTRDGADAVLVSIGAGAPAVGTYVGYVLDGNGKVVAPYVIYIDGL